MVPPEVEKVHEEEVTNQGVRPVGAAQGAHVPEPGSEEWWDSKPRQLWTKDIAELFEVSAKTVDRWAHEGKLCPTYTLGRHRRFAKEEVRALWEGRYH